MTNLIASILGDADLTPHGFCLLWRPGLVWLHVVSDLIIGISYYSIPLALIYLVLKRNDIAFSWLFWLFAAFITACGTTHFFSIWTLWRPDYGAEGLVKLATAAVSVFTAIALWPLLPRAIALPSPSMLERANSQLSQQVQERDQAYATLRDSEERHRELSEKLQLEAAQRERTEEQLRHAQKMEAIGSLTGGMAHDFNNLLGIVIANLDLIRQLKKGDRDLDEMTQDALDAALRGADLTRRLLAFARRQPLQPQRIDVNAQVSEAAKLLRRTLAEHIEISLDLAPDVWPVSVDPAQLEASLINLANNARDAMPSGGKLKITTANRHLDADYAALYAELVPGDYAMIKVSDTGTGMAPEILQHVFEPFFTTKRPDRGTGLGLSMVFGFIKQSGGHINVYSEPGMGTAFRLYLPRTTEEAAATEQDNTPSALHGAGETILLVEDDPSLRRAAVRQLAELGYRVIQAENGPTALQLLGDGNVDLLLTDIVMPGGMNGLELARRAQRIRPELRAVFMSGFSETEASGPTWSLPEDARLLQKPYRRDELAAIVRAALDQGTAPS